MNVLFLCTGNSARSILAEAILNDLPQARGRFHGFSAGSHPKAAVNPAVLQLLQENHNATGGLRSKGWDEFCRPDAPPMDFVFTLHSHLPYVEPWPTGAWKARPHRSGRVPLCRPAHPRCRSEPHTSMGSSWEVSGGTSFPVRARVGQWERRIHMSYP